MIATLSFVEHDRSIRPSTVLSVYLVLSALLEISQARTLFFREENTTLASVFIIGVVFKILTLVNETIEKRQLLETPYSNYPPEALGGIVNRSVFLWLNSLLLKGSSSILKLGDLFDLDKDLRSERLHARFRHAWASSPKSKSCSLLWTSICCARKPILAAICSRILLIGFKFSQPLLINRAVALLSEPDSQFKTNIGRALTGATALIYIGIAIMTGTFRHNTYRFITMFRGGLVCLIFDTTLTLNAGDAHESAAVTLMSTDIDRIAAKFELFDVQWAGPVEFAISTYLLYLEIGASCVVSILLATCFVTVCLAIGKMSASAQKEWVEAVQRRVSATVSVLSNMKGVKMTGLSRFVDAELQGLRVTELQISRKFRWILTASATISNMSTPALSTATLTVYVLVSRSSTGINLGSALAFTMISLISLLASSVQELSVAIPQMAAAMGCFQRIQKYLMTHSAHRCDRKQAEVSKSLTDNNMEMQCLMVTPDHSNRKGLLLSVNKGDFAFKATTEPTLHNITMQLPDETWTVLLGSVGSGKSALLLALLSELSHTNGSVYKQPFLQLAYCTQDPWLPNLTLRQVVIGYSNFEHNWYSTVIDACALARDLDELPSGDQTMIGTNGLSLSGGQEQRLSLARALYSRKQLLLLDDILSGLDPATEQRVVERVFGQNGLCRNNGVTVLLATHSVRHVYRADHAIVMGIGGKILEQGPPRSLSSFKDIGGSAQSNKSDTAIPSGDHTGVIGNASYEHDVLEHDAIQDELSRQAGDMRLYGYYLKAIRWANAIGLVVGDTLYAFCLKFPTVLLNWWSVAEAESPGTLTNMYLGIHGMFSLICLISFLLVVILLLHVGMPRSSLTFHHRLLSAVLKAPYWFFVSTDTGQILNRFSQDISLIDMQLPLAFLNSMYLTALCLIEAILIASTSKWSLAIYPGILAVLYVLHVLQKFYLRTSRQLRLLELEAKSPLYSQFSETLKGLVTIRAFGWQQVSMERNYNLLDESQKPYYLLWGIQRWLSLVLDLIVTVLATSIMALATQLGESSAGSLGVSLVSILTFSQNLTYLIRAWVDLETSLGAVARVRSFGRETPCEHLPSECSIPPNEWPRNGVIQVNNLSASYKAGTELVLDGISLAIEKGHKIGICGRTGSGKSSFILSLLKMVEIEHGDIIIDDHSLVAMPRDTLRRRVTVMPQEPLLLSGTIRFNVDPWSENTDNAIISALKEVDLWEAVLRRGGLDTKVDANSLSRGQQQLFCLARALLGRSQVPILDEATSNLDEIWT